MKAIKKLMCQICLPLIISVMVLPGCDDDYLNEQPLDQLSKSSFWITEKDAKLALTGLYSRSSAWAHPTGGNSKMTYLSNMTDDSRHKQPGGTQVGQLYVTAPETGHMMQFWSFSYRQISRVNVFLRNIDNVDMNADKKAEMIAEAKFLRAYQYFWMSQFWGGVPLVTDVLSIDEANNQSRNSKEEVVNFVLDELTEAAKDLPATRPSQEKGRILKAAAFAIKGRLLMSEKQWSEAAEAFKQIIELGVHEIDPRYKELFEEKGESSNEIIFAHQYVEDIYGDNVTQQRMAPGFYGRWGEMYAYQNLIEDFLMKDGKSIEESSIYDPDNPFENRDPRLYATIFLPGYTQFKGVTYQAHPDSTDLGVGNSSYVGHTGYAIKKFVDEDYTGDTFAYGGDYPLIRYAEVLLSYLESKLEAGDNISQSLLDQTINKVRGRQAVDMPPVTETNPDKLREILRRERRIELAFETGLRYWDLFRWRIAHIVLNNKFYGMKLTDNPESYDEFAVNEKGHLFSLEKTFNEGKDYLWPIPQSEIEINPKLTQNPGY